MDRKRWVIVVVNPLPKLYLTDLINHLYERNASGVHVLSFYRAPLLSEGLIDQARVLGAEVVQIDFEGRLDYVRKLRVAGMQLKSWLCSEGPVETLHCQPNHLLTNYATFAARRSRENLSCSLIPDGLANFYRVGVDGYRSRMLLKRLLGPLAGLPFRAYTGSYLALESAGYRSYLYFGDSGVMAEHLPCEEFDIRGFVASATRSGGWLFVGQPIHRGSKTATYRDLVRSALEAAEGRLTYKLHPAERDDAEYIAEFRGWGIDIVRTRESAEELAHRFCAVVGVASSTLLNIQLLGWQGDVYSVMDPDTLAALFGRSRPEADEIVKALGRLGVRSLF